MLKVTRYDWVSSFLIALALGLVLGVAWLSVVYVNNRISRTENQAELELLELPGGVDDGAPDETLRVESPEDVADDPSLEETPDDEVLIEETLENVIELADVATNQARQQFEVDVRSSGQVGSAAGTGRRPLGQGAGASGMPREQRWFVRFSDRGTIREYARQLDFFGIELGALLNTGELVYVSKLSAERPTVRRVGSGGGENRLYFTWRGGGRKQADLELFAKAGVDVGTGLIFHFYPRKTESLLARLERDYRNQPADKIRRTYFVAQRAESGYEFEVTRQTYFR